MPEITPENIQQPNVEICPSCYQQVNMIFTPGGLTICPRCGYSPTIGKRVRSNISPILGGPGVNIRDGFKMN